MSANEIVQDRTKSTRLTLSRPFSDLLVELSISLHKFVMYPKGNPSLAPAAASVVRSRVSSCRSQPETRSRESALY